MAVTSAPTFSGTIDQSYFIAPLGGPTNPVNLLDRFPDELYDKSPNSHFVRFMYALLGPAGVGWLSKNYLDARLKLMQHGFDTFDIEKFYANPMRFGRILDEMYTTDPQGLLPREAWDEIKAKDEAYRSRALTFFNAARAGGTPEGIKLAARSGLNHGAEVLENYKSLYDRHTDYPLILPHYGQTNSLEEFVIVPRQEESKSEVQTLEFQDSTIVGGQITLSFRGQSTTVAWNVNHLELQTALEALSTIGEGGVHVSGGPCPNPFKIAFTGSLSGQNVPQITALSSLVDKNESPKAVYLTTTVGGIEPIDEIVSVDPELEHSLQAALDLLRPVASLPTTSRGAGITTRQSWRESMASSEYTEVIRYVTGNPEIDWPEPDEVHWVRPNVEMESRRTQGDLQHHYVQFHNPAGVVAYTESALSDQYYATNVSVVANYDSTHVGLFAPEHVNYFPQLAGNTNSDLVFSATQALHENPDEPYILTQEDNTLSPLIGGTISVNAPSVVPNGPSAIRDPFPNKVNGRDQIQYQELHHWSSLERRPPAADFLEIDLGEVRVVNLIEMDIRMKPIDIDINYDVRDNNPGREWEHVKRWSGHKYVTRIEYDNRSNGEWTHIRTMFKNQRGNNVFTRFLRIKFERREVNKVTRSGLFDSSGNPLPYSIDVKKLKVGRYANVFGDLETITFEGM